MTTFSVKNSPLDGYRSPHLMSCSVRPTSKILVEKNFDQSHLREDLQFQLITNMKKGTKCLINKACDTFKDLHSQAIATAKAATERAVFDNSADQSTQTPNKTKLA